MCGERKIHNECEKDRDLDRRAKMIAILLIVIPATIVTINVLVAWKLAASLSLRTRSILQAGALVTSLWLTTCICWLVSSFPLGYALAMGHVGAQLPLRYRSPEEVLFFEGLGNLAWLVLVLLVDSLLFIYKRPRR